MNSKSNLFTVNGQPMFAPDMGVDIFYADMESEDSGQDESGVLHRTVVRYKVGTWSFHYSSITESEKQYLESLFPDAPDFEFGHPDRLDASVQTTCRAYRSEYGLCWYNAREGLWKNYKFNIVEC